MLGPKKRFTPEFRAEAVRLARTSGRSRREIAADLGVGLSALRAWIDGQRDREMEEPSPDRQEHLAAELKRLRRENGLRARQPRRFQRTADSRHAFPVAPNLLDQDLSAGRPNGKWAADISHIGTREGWVYLAVVIDLDARRVVGWAVSDRLHKELALRALRQALAMRRPAAGLLCHSDRGGPALWPTRPNSDATVS